MFSGKNPTNVDSVVAAAMGFDPRNIGYLHYLSRLGYGEIIGIEAICHELRGIKTRFMPHSTYTQQLAWRLPKEMEQDIIGSIADILSSSNTRKICRSEGTSIYRGKNQ